MASSGNFCVMNPLVRTTNTMVYSFGNLRTSPSSNWSTTTWARGSMVIPSDKKIYFEVLLQNQTSVYSVTGIGTNLSVPSSSNVGGDGSVTIYNTGKFVNGSSTTGLFSTLSSGTILQIAVDGSTRKVWLGYNNTWIGSGDPANGTNEAGTVNVSNSLGNDLMPVGQNNSIGVTHYNFGADSSFGGEKTSGSANASDSNSVGDFYYTPPNNFLALSSANLPISDDIDPAQTDDNFPQKQFGVVTYTGNGGASQSITGLGFQPDLVWLKQRSASELYSNNLIDSTRGRSKTLYSSRADAEATSASDKDFGTFDSDGFTVLDDFNTNMNQSSITNVGWCWRANGGVTSSNTQGDITSTVQVNDNAGFSIISFSGSGSAQSVGHGLSVAPDMVITKNRSTTDDWRVHHKGLTNGVGTYHLKLNTNASETNDASCMSGSPSNTVLNLGNNTSMNGSGNNIIMYAWREIEGFSKFSRFVGNGNNDGPFIYTGFRPRLWFIKEISSSDDWVVYDTARDTFNSGSSKVLRWDSSNSEFDDSSRAVDVTSNGLKIRTSNATMNGSGVTYIFGAWGDVPFKYNNTF